MSEKNEGVWLSEDEITSLSGCLDTIIEEANAMPQVGGPKATIIEQATAAGEILMVECPACSRAGGADRAVFHLRPACPDSALASQPAPEEQKT